MITTNGLIEYPDYELTGDAIRFRRQTIFSPDGTHYIQATNKGLNISKFDRSIGKLIDNKFIVFNAMLGLNGCSFSPNNRFVYFSNYSRIYQMDLFSEDSSFELVTEWDGYKYGGYDVSFSLMQTGPDCKIYVLNPSCLPFVHVIMKPDVKGQGCQVKQRAIKLPTGICSFPHFPNFRLGTSEPCCDPDKVVITSTQTTTDEDTNLKIFPNPSSGDFTITSDDVMSSVVVYDIHGQKIVRQSTDSFQTNISLLHQNSGVYFVHVRYKNNQQHKVRKIVLIP